MPPEKEELQELRKLQRELRRHLESMESRLAALEVLRKEGWNTGAGEEDPDERFAPRASPETDASTMEASDLGAAAAPPPPKPEQHPEMIAVPPPLPDQKTEPHPKTAPSAVLAETPGFSAGSAPTKPKPAEPKESLELQLGRVWLVRIGIVILLTGLVFLGNFAYQELIGRLGAPGRLFLLFFASGVLAGLGGFLMKKSDSLRQYGRVLVGGGLATSYFAVFAAHFVEPLRVISSPLAGGLLLLGYAIFLFILADRLRSQTIATVTLVLGFYISAMNPMAEFSLYGNFLLAAIAVVLLLRKGWHSLSLLSVLGTYGALLYWNIQTTGTLPGFDEMSVRGFVPAFGFPLVYWILFTASSLLPSGWKSAAPSQITLVSLNNAFFFALGGPAVFATFPQHFWIFPVLLGILLLSLAGFVIHSKKYPAGLEAAWLVQGLFFVPLGIAIHFTGYFLVLSLALGSTLLLVLSSGRHGRILFGFAFFFAGIASLVTVSEIHSDRLSLLQALATSLVLLAGGWLACKKFAREPAADGWLHAGTLNFFCVFQILFGIFPILGLIYFTGTFPAGFLWMAGLGGLILLCFHASARREFWLAAHLVFAMLFLTWFGLPAHFSVRLQALVLFATAILAGHWSRCNPPSPQSQATRVIHIIAAVLLGLTWINAAMPQAEKAPAMLGLGLLLVLFGAGWRSHPLAVGGLAAGVPGASLLFLGMIESTGASLPTLLGIALMAVAIRASDTVLARLEWVSSGARAAQRVLCWVCVAMFCFWVVAFVPQNSQAFLLAVVFFAAAGLSLRQRAVAGFFLALPLAGTALVSLLLRFLQDTPFSLPDWVAAGLLIASGKLAMRFEEHISRTISPWLVWAGLATLWFLFSQKLLQYSWPLTVAWTLFALAVLVCGFVWKDRCIRLFGMGVLLLSVARIFLVDVWHLETGLRILSFLLLGAVLLLLGFLYNRFSESIKKWI